MWIRIQSRKQLVNASEFNIVERYGEFGVYAGAVVLGNYSTEEKATKVMDMIETAILGNEIANSVIDIGYWKKGLFQIPKDDEVEV